VKMNLALALLLIAGLAGCGRSSPEAFDQVKGVRVDWTNPQLADLALALDTCEAWGTDAAIVRSCAERREEARAIVDGIVTCQQIENAEYPACERIRAWADSRPPGIAELLRIAGTRGTATDLSTVRNLFRPPNPLIGGAWSNDDRWLSFLAGGWMGIAIAIAVLGVGAMVAIWVHSRRPPVGNSATISAAPQAPASPPFTSVDLNRLIEEDAERRRAANAEADRVAAAQEAERLATQSALAAERAEARQRQEEEAEALRSAAEDAKREFDQIKDLF
jgi:hypothetical protein